MEENVMNIMENATDAITEDTTVPATQSAKMVGGNNAVIRTLVIGGALVGAILLVKRNQIKAKITDGRIKWLEKRGYTVVKNEEIVDETIEVYDEDIAD